MRDIILGNEKSKNEYEELKAQYELAHGPVTPAADSLLLKVVYLEGLHEQAVHDLGKGLREPYKVNTWQSGTRDNKALGMALKIQTQQARLLKELKLLPQTKPGAAAENEDDGEHDISDY